MSEEDIKRGKTEQKVKDVMYDLACAAHQHLETVSKSCRAVENKEFGEG